MSCRNRGIRVKLDLTCKIKKLNNEIRKITNMTNEAYESCGNKNILSDVPLSAVKNAEDKLKDSKDFLCLYKDLVKDLCEVLQKLKNEYENLDLDNSLFDATDANVDILLNEAAAIIDNMVGSVKPLSPPDVDGDGFNPTEIMKGINNIVTPLIVNLYNFNGVNAPTDGIFGQFTDVNGDSTFNVAWDVNGVLDLFNLQQTASDDIFVGEDQTNGLDVAITEIDDLLNITDALGNSLNIYDDVVDNNLEKVENLIEKRECRINEDKARRIEKLTEEIEFSEIVLSSL
tara:strand:+ start:282 stop:1142 length:861 start_codon:yes stop_codon:yes gene_type:complete